ncbi:Crp/Fnr family transcriptional regulator [Pseudoduganella umbonata]|uniref:CRP-like cAMP-binding protein n=1 Tax=Pseudoduganella umbonata TaxID=864828 RepID=A0A4V1ED61_9BURK|nr:Crp/Fnr family transcriptional regulator [Pseudoduganella umbonata]MBB3219948.1 CRP-like cAMP-binding protein [Pseudoduganella umbonata]QCP09961.1 Crp/Fnr family transcriptional regulator [Pseudoduganella umbonata]
MSATSIHPIPPGGQGASVPEERQIQIHLRKIPLLAGLAEEEIALVKQEIRVRQYSKRDIVLHKGGHGDGLLFLLSGQLQVVDVTKDGRTIGLRMLAPGDFFGEIALIDNSRRTASIVAISNVLVGFLPAATALHLFSHSPSVAKRMLQHLAEKIQRDSEFRSLLSINNTSRRIYTYLVLMQKDKQSEPGSPAVLENLPTHQDIANMINTSRETVTRALTVLAQKGIVQKEASRLIIIKPDALQELVNSS